MRFVITGYRDWSVARSVFEVMDEWIKPPYMNHVVAQGGCPTGADAMARAFCQEQGIPMVTFHANWDTPMGKRFGPFRNQVMIDIMRPELVLAFLHPLSKGTVGCVAYAEAKGYKVLPTWEGK